MKADSQMWISHRVPLVDEPIEISVSGLEPGAHVTIDLVTSDGRCGAHCSSAVFEADEKGVVNSARQAPATGSYVGVDPMGLFWSAVPDDASAGTFNERIDPIPTEISVRVGGSVIHRRAFQRLRIDPSTTIKALSEDGMVGTLFTPPGDGPHPPLVVLGGSGGGHNEARAALLASHGFAALALAYFRHEGLPDAIANYPLEYFQRAMEWLRGQDNVSSDWLGVTGASKGGELSLLLGATYPQVVKAVVGVVPSGLIHSGITPPGHRVVSSWSLGGKPLPYVAFDPVAGRMDSNSPDRIAGFLAALEDTAAVEAAEIPVERIAGPVLLVTGRDDRMWPSPILSEIAIARLRAHSHPHPFEHRSYDYAGHAIRPPFLPTTILIAHGARHATTRTPLRGYGGTPEGNAWASRDSWRRLVNWFQRSWRER